MTSFEGRIGADARSGGFGGVGSPAATATNQVRRGAVGDVAVVWMGRPRLAGAIASIEQLCNAFASSPAQVPDALTGAFAIAMYDAASGSGLVATDRMGIHPVFLVEADGSLAFAAEPARALAMAGQAPELDPQAIFDYLYCHVVPAPHAAFRSVRRLMPGECVELRAGRITWRRYWTPRFVEDQRRNFSDLQAEFRAALRTAVSEAMGGARCGAFLSGGTDSSTIAGLLTEVTGQPAQTFSIGFEARGFDEMEYARLASRHFGTRHHEYYVTPDDIVDAVPRLAAAYGQPFGNSSALPAYYCARLAREAGVDFLLAGDGGDELFGGNARYAKQALFSQYERLPAPLRHGLIEPGCRQLARVGRIPGLSKIVSYVDQASIPMPDRLDTYNLLDRIGGDQVLTSDFALQVDRSAPRKLNRDAYLNPTAGSLINRMLALDFKTTLADNDLPKVMESCRLAGVPVGFPMLDHRVVDFSLSLEPELKLRGTQLRYFFKEALRGFLPEEIIRKQKHGFGLPFGEWAVSNPRLRGLTYETLNQFKRRGWVRPEHIDTLKDRLLPELPNYYGTLAWIYMMLELWMQHHVDVRREGS